MATINRLGNVIARCPGCDGGTSTFEYRVNGKPLGVVVQQTEVRRSYDRFPRTVDIQFRLFRCAGCGGGAIAAVLMHETQAEYPDRIEDLIWFEPEAKERLRLVDGVPHGIRNEFREAEACLEHGCHRAATAMFRSVLDKTLRANGYKIKKGISLEQEIDEAAKDGVITEARRRKAHEDIRVLGNDVLHDEWHELTEEDVEPAHHYTQRILEDFYDDREAVLRLLRKAGRVPQEDQQPKTEEET